MTLADQLTEKWAKLLKDVRHVPTWTEPASLAYCAEVASRSKVMVESGSYMGASALAMLKASEDHPFHIWLVDKWEVFGTKGVTEHFVADFIRSGRCELIQGDMDKAGIMLPHMTGMVDSIFIDDGHAEVDLQRDIRNAVPLLKSGGELFGHDFDVPYNDVARGVLSMLPVAEITIPVPRVWSWRKP